MTIKEAREKSLRGGFDTSDLTDAEMCLKAEFFSALGKSEGWIGENIRMCTGCGVSCKNKEITAWGKHKGWWNGQKFTGCDSDVYDYDGQWLIEMHCLIDHLAEGGTIEDFFSRLDMKI